MDNYYKYLKYKKKYLKFKNNMIGGETNGFRCIRPNNELCSLINYTTKYNSINSCKKECILTNPTYAPKVIYNVDDFLAIYKPPNMLVYANDFSNVSDEFNITYKNNIIDLKNKYNEFEKKETEWHIITDYLREFKTKMKKNEATEIEKLEYKEILSKIKPTRSIYELYKNKYNDKIKYINTKYKININSDKSLSGDFVKDFCVNCPYCDMQSNCVKPYCISSYISSLFIETGQKYKIFNQCKYQFGVCNRLDELTSGIVLIAKNPDSWKNIRSLINNHSTFKLYMCLVNGKVNTGESDNIIEQKCFKSNHFNKTVEFNSYIKGSKSKFQIVEETLEPSGKYCTTIIIPVNYYNYNSYDYTLCMVRILTGYHHQIRSHLHNLGHPLVSDEIYLGLNKSDEYLNNNLLFCDRLFLHAMRYEVLLKGVVHKITCPLPNDLVSALNIIKKTEDKNYSNNDDCNTVINETKTKLLQYR